MIEYVKPGLSAQAAIELQLELQRDGLVRGVDFDWKYFHNPVRKTVFIFYSDELGLIYAFRLS